MTQGRSAVTTDGARLGQRDDAWVEHGDRRLVLLVGGDTAEQRDLARGLIRRGTSFIACSLPAGCPLLVDDQCPLVELADVAVITPSRPSRHDVPVELSLCAQHVRALVVVEPAQPELRQHAAAIARSMGTDAVMAAIDDAIARTGVRKG